MCKFSHPKGIPLGTEALKLNSSSQVLNITKKMLSKLNVFQNYIVSIPCLLVWNQLKASDIDKIMMDYAKDFNKVNHNPLTQKLYHCIIREQINMWISSFLTGQQQVAVIKDTKSDYIDVNSGVPQGSVLGPCLFLT